MAFGVVVNLGRGVGQPSSVAFGVVVDGDGAVVVVHRIPFVGRLVAGCCRLCAPSGPSFRVGDDTTDVRVYMSRRRRFDEVWMGA